ncbi:hypothetical protein V8C44DRAFT_172965 [Trichoderma aethiopicum]
MSGPPARTSAAIPACMQTTYCNIYPRLCHGWIAFQQYTRSLQRRVVLLEGVWACGNDSPLRSVRMTCSCAQFAIRASTWLSRVYQSCCSGILLLLTSASAGCRVAQLRRAWIGTGGQARRLDGPGLSLSTRRAWTKESSST